MIKRVFALPGISAPCVEHPGRWPVAGGRWPVAGGRLGVPQIVIVVVVFAWVLAAAVLGIPEGSLIGLLTAAGTVAAHLIGRTGPRPAATDV